MYTAISPSICPIITPSTIALPARTGFIETLWANDKRLIIQLNGLSYKVSKSGNLLFDSPDKSSIHDDHLWARAGLSRGEN